MTEIASAAASADRLAQMPAALCTWYKANARSLPWRAESAEETSPYHVWISEIMLQQTRIEAVKKYYDRFIRALPTVRDLAHCPEDRLLKLWEGLGYYNRARNLQKAAQLIEEQYAGVLPSEYEQLLALPGFGPYTAGAVASICFDRPVSAVDGNVLRVFARLNNDPSDVLSIGTRKRTEAVVRRLFQLNTQLSPGTFNQAVMELGETVCSPGGEPDCSHCPVSFCCLALENGSQKDLPVRIKKTKRRIEHKTMLVITDGRRAVIRRRGSRGLLAGMYELPSLPGAVSGEEALKWLKENNIHALRIQPLPEASHIFSHIEWKMTGFRVMTEDLAAVSTPLMAPFLQELQDTYPIPGAFAAYTEWLDVKVGAAGFDREADGRYKIEEIIHL